MNRNHQKELRFLYFPFCLLCIMGCTTLPPIHPPRIQKVHLTKNQKYIKAKLVQAVDILHQVDTLETIQDEEKYLKYLLHMDPNDSTLFWRMARTYQWRFENEPIPKEKEKWAKQAMNFGGKGVFLNPKSGPCHYYYAIGIGLYLQLYATTAIKGLPKLIEHGQLAVKYSPQFDYAGPHRLLGRVYLEAPAHLGGDLDLALQHLKKAVELAPNFAENLLALGEAYWEDEEYSLAKKCFLRIYKGENFQDVPRSLLNMRKKALEKLIELDAHYGEYYIALAKIYIELKKRNRALEVLETFLALDSLKDSPPIQEDLKRQAKELLTKVKPQK